MVDLIEMYIIKKLDQQDNNTIEIIMTHIKYFMKIQEHNENIQNQEQRS